MKKKWNYKKWMKYIGVFFVLKEIAFLFFIYRSMSGSVVNETFSNPGFGLWGIVSLLLALSLVFLSSKF